MDRIRKFVDRVWSYKVRIVFVAMVGISCLYVYRGWNVPEEKALEE